MDFNAEIIAYKINVYEKIRGRYIDIYTVGLINEQLVNELFDVVTNNFCEFPKFCETYLLIDGIFNYDVLLKIVYMLRVVDAKHYIVYEYLYNIKAFNELLKLYKYPTIRMFFVNNYIKWKLCEKYLCLISHISESIKYIKPSPNWYISLLTFIKFLSLLTDKFTNIHLKILTDNLYNKWYSQYAYGCSKYHSSLKYNSPLVVCQESRYLGYNIIDICYVELMYIFITNKCCKSCICYNSVINDILPSGRFMLYYKMRKNKVTFLNLIGLLSLSQYKRIDCNEEIKLINCIFKNKIISEIKNTNNDNHNNLSFGISDMYNYIKNGNSNKKYKLFEKYKTETVSYTCFIDNLRFVYYILVLTTNYTKLPIELIELITIIYASQLCSEFLNYDNDMPKSLN